MGGRRSPGVTKQRGREPYLTVVTAVTLRHAALSPKDAHESLRSVTENQV